ncbi:DUF2306 domain-containing protein [Georgenia sp. AZ-5]|uniref:DUF2306 domain-containing protein n=1 Tax=Georgenia sp. AZ-5 TaxID=3367526 RepID=UPI00375527EE
MSVTAATAPSAPAGPRRPNRRRTRRHRVLLGVVALLSLGVVGYAAVVYFGFDPSTSQVGLREEVPWHYPVLMAHITTAAVALAVGPLQFSRRIRAHRRVHRWIGRTYLFAGVLPSALVGVPAALLSTGGPVAAAGLLVGDVAWGVTAVVAYRAARQRRYRDHARWMTRNFALTFAAVTFRIWLPLLILAQLPILGTVHRGDFDALFAAAYAITCWLAFLPNLFAVMTFQRRSRRSTAALGRAAAAA